MQLSLKVLEFDEYDKWNDFVNKSPQGSIFNLTWYLSTLNLKFDIVSVVDEKNKIYTGIVLVKNEIKTFSNPTFVKYLGLLFENDSKSLKEISLRYKISNILILHLKKIKTFDYYFHPTYDNWIPFSWMGFSQQTRYTYHLNLNLSIDEIYINYHSKMKNDIKNAINKNIRIIYFVENNKFYDVINKTFLRQGGKAPFSKKKILDFISHLEQKDCFSSFGAIDENNNLLAVCGCVYHNKTSHLILNGIDSTKSVRGANALMIHESIKYLKTKGILTYDFEGSMLNGVEQFYRRFGGNLVPYMKIWNDNFLNYSKSKLKKIYKKFKYGR